MAVFRGFVRIASLAIASVLMSACGADPAGEPSETPPPDSPDPVETREVELAVLEEVEEFGEAQAARLQDGDLTVTIWTGEDTITPDDIDHIQSVAGEVAGAQADDVEVIVSEEDPPTED